MAVPDELYETVNDAVQALTRAARRWGAEAARDAISEARDTPDEDATPFDNALYDTVADALAQAEDMAEGRTRVAILTPDGARVTWSWLGHARPAAEFETMVMNSVGRALGLDVSGSDERCPACQGDECDPIGPCRYDDGDERLGTLTGPRGLPSRYRIGWESGEVFGEGEDFDGCTVTVEIACIEDGVAIVETVDRVAALERKLATLIAQDDG